MDELLREMGKRISMRRKQLSLTQEELAEKAGLTSQTISMHIPDQQLHMHGILAPLRRSGAPLHERKERDLYNWCSTGNCDYINWRSDHAKLSGDFEAG